MDSTTSVNIRMTCYPDGCTGVQIDIDYPEECQHYDLKCWQFSTLPEVLEQVAQFLADEAPAYDEDECQDGGLDASRQTCRSEK